MIVIAGIPTEPPIRLAIEAAETAGIDHVVVNQRRAAEYDIHLHIGETVTGRVVIDGRSIELDDVDGIYWRMMEADRLPENGAGARELDRQRSLMFHQAFTNWVDTAACRVANRLAPMGSNASKPYQALLIERAGFATPPSVITTIAADVAAAHDEWGPLIYKSASSVRSIVRTLEEPTAEALSSIALLPTQFQRTVAGTDVRVHVVGNDVHATEIVSDAVDYRYARRDGLESDLRPYELPAEIADRCRRLAVELELPFCGIDLRRSVDSRGATTWTCFEVNPSPGYSYYESNTGQPIAGSLVQWLEHG